MADGTNKTLLLVDDDKPFLTRLGRALEARGFEVRLAETVGEGIAEVRKSPPGFAVVDLRLGDGNGLDVVQALHAAKPDARVVVLTGYGNIATAVTAVKLGAIDCATAMFRKRRGASTCTGAHCSASSPSGRRSNNQV
jgi:two-component system response regulator RegA